MSEATDVPGIARDEQPFLWCGRLAGAAVVLVIVASLAASSGGAAAKRAVGSSGRASLGTSALATVAAASPRRTDLSSTYIVDLTWVSEDTGWALSAARCGRLLCPRIAATVNGGRSWTALPDPPAYLSTSSAATYCTRPPCVDHLRFATATIGYLFGPSLLITRDGGETWTRVASPPVESLEPGPDTVVRLVYDHDGCPGPCQRTLEAAPAGSDHWRVLLADLSADTSSSAVNAQVIRAGAEVIYVPIYGNLAAGAGTQQTTIYRSLDAGRSWARLADPCGGAGAGLRDAIAIAAAPGGLLAALCTTRNASTYGYSVVSSTDDGASWRARRPVPAWAQFSPDHIAAAGPSTMVITNSPAAGSGRYTYRLMLSSDGGKAWSSVASDPEQLEPNAPYATYLGFQDSLVGRWVGYQRLIWTTTDGGRHWTRRRFA